jgi:hypothetical protein
MMPGGHDDAPGGEGKEQCHRGDAKKVMHIQEAEVGRG